MSRRGAPRGGGHPCFSVDDDRRGPFPPPADPAHKNRPDASSGVPSRIRIRKGRRVVARILDGERLVTRSRTIRSMWLQGVEARTAAVGRHGELGTRYVRVKRGDPWWWNAFGEALAARGYRGDRAFVEAMRNESLNVRGRR